MVWLLLSCFLFAQEDSNRWSLLPQQKLQVGLGLSTPSLEFTVEPKDSANAHNLKFEPNTGTTTNLILGINQTTLAIGLDTSTGGSDPVKTKGYDILYRTYFSKYGLDLYYQTYKGFYLDDANTIYKYPDLQQRKFGAIFTYVFNPERYSLSAAFSNSHIQRRSGGSFLATLGVDKFSLANPDILVPVALDRTKYGEGGTISNIDALSLSLGGGYGYTLVFYENWYLTVSLILPVSISAVDYEDQSATTNSISINSSMALGYNNEKFRAAFYIHQNTQNVDLKDDSTLGSSTLETGVVFIYRWDDKKIADKIYSLSRM